MGWRSTDTRIALYEHSYFSREQILELDVYQFGVFKGDSMIEISKILLEQERYPRKFWGFDVFSGMPKETEEPIFQDSWDPDKMPDAFNLMASNDNNYSTPDECAIGIQNKITSIFENYTVPEKNDDKEIRPYQKTEVNIISGLVEETLSKQELRPAYYIDFDMDIYSPTKYAFKYMVENNLVIPGTIIGYDDWGGTPEFEKFKYGESRAHKEICDEYGIKMTKLYQTGIQFPHVQTTWIVTGGV